MNAVFAKVFATRPESRYARGLDFARDLQTAAAQSPDLEIRHEAQPDSPRTVVQVLAPTVHTPPPPPPPPPQPVPPAPAPAPAPPGLPHPVAQRGALSLDSDPPGARVFVDGQPAGHTPLGPVQLTLGRYLVRMEADGYGAFSAEVELQAGRPVRWVGFTLPRSAPEQPQPAGSGAWQPGMRPARRLSGATPAYPDTARERGLEGSPVVEILISETGEVTDAAVVQSAGNLLDLALLQAVESWRFEPARQADGTPTPLRLLVQHHFRR
jgi:TonB family protein